MLPITIWYRLSDSGLEHNHIEVGHVPETQTVPMPLHPNHVKGWANGTWIPFHGFLDNQKCPPVVTGLDEQC
jgi:hypothetical protein